MKNKKKLEENIQIIIETNNKKYNKLKLIEELNELSTELVKSLTKEDGEGLHEKIIEECGDVVLRLEVFMLTLKKKDLIAILNRSEEKAQKLADYARTKKYKNV